MMDDNSPGASSTDIAAPSARENPHTVSHHGFELEDPYHWLRADNWQDVMRDPSVLDAGIRQYLEAENTYTEAVLGDTKALQNELFEEMKGRIKQDDSSVPARDGAFAYFVAYETGEQHPVYCREPREGGERQVLIDGNALAARHDYFELGGLDHSPDHNIVAYGFDDAGSEYFTIKFRDIASGHDLDDVIEDTSGGVEWSADAGVAFYVRVDENHRPSKVYAHTLGTRSDQDRLIYEEHDPSFFVGLDKTQSGRFIVIAAHDHQTSEAYLIDAHAPDEPPRLIAAREPGVEYDVDHHGQDLIILTNADDAEDFKIVTTPLDEPGRENWREMIGYEPGRLILSHVVYDAHLVRLERKDGHPAIIIRALDGGDEHNIAFDEEAYSLGLSAGYEFNTTRFRFTYSSMTTPAQVFDYDMVSRERTLRKTQEVPSGHEPQDYVTRRVFAEAHDGEKIPVSLLYRAGTAIDGSAPLLLYGYGAYGISIPAGFSTNRLSLVDRGAIYAIAHIRGGKDKGYAWYRTGKTTHKTNTFRDFLDAARYLVQEGFTRPGNIVAHGGSAGGMLMGAVANMAPELFKGIIAEVPFVDVLNTMLDASLPLTPPEWTEWGNPIDDPEAFETIAGYSPYDNVTEQTYPHILALAGLSDPRVTYWEPAKWIAKLRVHNTGNNLLLLKTNMQAGHGGASGRFDRLEEVALAYAFALKIWGWPLNMPRFER